MALPKVSIVLTSGQLGLVAPGADGVVGIVFNALAASGLALGVSKQGFGLDEFEAVGITAAFDTTNTLKVWRQIKEFYDEAGDGAELWVMLVSQATNMTSILDKTQAFAKKLLDDAAGRIKLLGVGRNPAGGYTPSTTANQIDLDVINALVTGQALVDDQLAIFRPINIVVEGYAYTGTTSTLADLKIQTKKNISILIGNSETGARAAIGLLLGRLASVPVMRNPGRVKDGSVTMIAAFLGSAAFETVESSATAIHDKGYITLRKYTGKAGYYFSDDPTSVASTDDYSSLARCRVINKAIRIAYATYVEEILDEVEIDPTTGFLSAAKAKYYQSLIERAVNTAMAGEISGFAAYVDPSQNVLSTNKICIYARIVPFGYAKEIEVQLGFANKLN